MRRQIDRQLLVADGVLQHGFVQRLEAGQLLLLLLFRAADQCQLPADLRAWAVAGHLVAELHGFKLRAVHQDDAALGVGIHLPGMIGPGIQGAQALQRVGNGHGLLHKGITLLRTHCLPAGAALCAGTLSEGPGRRVPGKKAIPVRNTNIRSVTKENKRYL